MADRRPATIEDLKAWRRLYWRRDLHNGPPPGRAGQPIGRYNYDLNPMRHCESGVMVVPEDEISPWDLGWFEVPRG